MNQYLHTISESNYARLSRFHSYLPATALIKTTPSRLWYPQTWQPIEFSGICFIKAWQIQTRQTYFTQQKCHDTKSHPMSDLVYMVYSETRKKGLRDRRSFNQQVLNQSLALKIIVWSKCCPRMSYRLCDGPNPFQEQDELKTKVLILLLVMQSKFMSFNHHINFV